MKAPKLEDQTRADLNNTGLVYDNAMGSSASSQLSDRLEGVNKSAEGLLKPSTGFDQGLGMNPMSQAIQAKSQAKYNQGAQANKVVQKQQAKGDYFEKLQSAHQLVGQEMQMNQEKAMEKYKREKAAKRARAGVVGQVLGTVVGIVAGIYTGGTGAAAGYAAGNAAGTALAGGGD